MQSTDTKSERYRSLLTRTSALLQADIHPAGNLCNVLAELKSEFDLFWVGLYLRKGNRLVLGPFQGLPACTVIEWGKGVCGTAAHSGQTQIVNDVLEYPGYIACHQEVRSEIVVPGILHGQVAFVLDVDSTQLATFDNQDVLGLQNFASIIKGYVSQL